MNDLVAFDEIRREIAIMESPDELDEARARVEAATVYARRKGIRPAVIEGLELTILLDRRLGELLPSLINHGGDPSYRDGTLADLGLSGNQSSRYQKLAGVPEEVLERYFATCRSRDEEPQRKRLERIARELASDDDEEVVDLAEGVAEVVDLRDGDLRGTLDDLAGQVDAIITDPPYPREFIEEFDALGHLATKLLTPTGVLVAMVGQTHLPAYLDRLGRHLDYRWCGAYLTEGPATRVHGRSVGTKWKPILIFGGDRFLTQDVFVSTREDKDHHDWGQSESGMADIVARFTNPGELVVDPFLGGGTTAVVCRDLGRRFVGCDIDDTAVRTTKRRLAA